MTRKKKSINLNWRYIIPAVIVVALVVVTGIEVFGRSDSTTTDNPQNSAQNIDVDDGAEQDPATSTKDSPPDSSRQPETTGSGKIKATPTVTYVGQDSTGGPVLVKASVSGVFEDGGVCTAVLVKDGQTVSGSSKGVSNVSDVSCPQISIPRSEFGSSGTWQLKITYSSAKAEGESSQQAVEIN